MVLNHVFERFCGKTPFAVMARSLLERTLTPEALDDLFEEKADSQYARELTFSSIVDLMGQVVTSAFPSIRAAYLDKSLEISVSLTSVYNSSKASNQPSALNSSRSRRINYSRLSRRLAAPAGTDSRLPNARSRWQPTSVEFSLKSRPIRLLLGCPPSLLGLLRNSSSSPLVRWVGVRRTTAPGGVAGDR